MHKNAYSLPNANLDHCVNLTIDYDVTKGCVMLIKILRNISVH